MKTNKIKEEVKIDIDENSFKLLLEHRYCRNCDVILRNEDKEYCENCLRLIQQTQKQATADFKENMLMTKSNHQLGCMLECYEQVIANRIGFEKEAKQLMEISSKLK